MTHGQDGYVKIIAVCFMFGFVFLKKAIKAQKLVRQVQDTPRSKISSAPQGLVEIQGFAWPKEKGVLTPTGCELVYYSFSLERETGSGKNRKWVSVYSQVHQNPFYLLDPTGLAIIDPATSELEIDQPKIKLWNSLKMEEQNYYLEKQIPMSLPNFPPKGGLFSAKYRIVEKEIRSGSPLYVTGDFRTPNTENKKVMAAGLTHFANRVIDFNSKNFKNVNAHLDTNGDGVVSYKEAKDGYSIAAQVSQKKTSMDGLTENEFEVHGELRSTPQRKLFLADTHEAQLINKLNSNYIPKFVGGAALIAIAIVMTVRLFMSDAAIESAMSLFP
jgi:hypothetical protein